MLNDKIKAKQDAFIEFLKTVSVLSHLTDDERRDIVFTIAGAFTGGKAILEVLPTPVMSPTEIRIVHEVIMEQTATIADLVYQHFVPQASQSSFYRGQNLRFCPRFLRQKIIACGMEINVIS